VKHAGQAWPSTPALAAMLLGGGLMLLVLTPPFQAPDEPNHLLRAYQVSEGGVVSPKNADGLRGGMLPEPLIDAALTGFASLRARKDVHTSLDEWRQILDAAERVPRLDITSRRFIGFPNSARYSPVPYVPAAVALAIGRVIGANAYALLYAARLANLLTAMALTAAALAALADDPRARLALFAFAAPRCACFWPQPRSADAVTNGRLLRRRREPSSQPALERGSLLALLIAAALLSLGKGVSSVAAGRRAAGCRGAMARDARHACAVRGSARCWLRPSCRRCCGRDSSTRSHPGTERFRGRPDLVSDRTCAFPPCSPSRAICLRSDCAYISEMIGARLARYRPPDPMRLLYALSILLLSIIGVRAQKTLLVDERERPAPQALRRVGWRGDRAARVRDRTHELDRRGEKVYGIQGRYFIPRAAGAAHDAVGDAASRA
jgi:hypothetical protein